MRKAIALDVETTGLDPEKHRIIEIAVVDFDTAETLLHTKIDPECYITEEITAINHISNADVVGAPKFHDVAVQIVELVEKAEAVIGYNPYFDAGMIDGEMRRLGITITWPIIVCAKRVWDAHEPRVERNLMNAYKRFVNNDGYEGRHGALPDTLAVREVLRSQMDHFDLHGKTWEQFDPQRASWWGPTHHVLIDEKNSVLTWNLGKHKGTPVHEIDDGFWRWLQEKDFPDHVLALSLTVREMIPKHDKKDPDYFRRELFTWAKDSHWRKKRA